MCREFIKKKKQLKKIKKERKKTSQNKQKAQYDGTKCLLSTKVKVLRNPVKRQSLSDWNGKSNLPTSK